LELLFSNYPPLKTSSKTFYDTFYDLLAKSTSMDFAVGYITADSLTDLKNTLEQSSARSLNLIIGMHYFEKFTHLEYQSALSLHDFLKTNHIGGVKLVTPFKYHGKMYTYSNSGGTFAGIIGSNNLSSIVDNRSRIYESALLVDERTHAQQMKDFIDKLSETSTSYIDELEIIDFKQQNSLLDNHENVEKVDNSTLAECITSLTETTFDVPIKASNNHTKSNLNVFYGKGREGKNGLIKARHWYEAEIIVAKDITSRPNYPQADTSNSIFDVITDDGWKFKCKISGTNSKNFRSENDLKILGKWLKGRLENAGALKVGQLVTDETLRKYGRDTFTITKTNIDNLWYLDFEVK